MQLFKAKQLAQKEVDKALADVGMTMDEVRAYLKKHPSMTSAFHRAPHKAGCTTADLVYEVGARKNRLRYLKARVVATVTRQGEEGARGGARQAARSRAQGCGEDAEEERVVTVAPEVDPEEAGGAADSGRPQEPPRRELRRWALMRDDGNLRFCTSAGPRRARARSGQGRRPRLRGVNEALGRPLADAGELGDCRAFAARADGHRACRPLRRSGQCEQAPVLVYYMDKQKRDVAKLTDILDAQRRRRTRSTNIQEDPAAQSAVRRDSNGQRLPVVFVAGECIGDGPSCQCGDLGRADEEVFG